MAEKKVLLTQAGYDELVKKLDYLISVKRLEVAARLNAAIALGDLSENSEYDDAKTEQAFVEGEILAVKAKIDNSEIIQTEGAADVVRMGSCVVVKDLEFDDEEAFMIVGSTEADPMNNKISNESPLGKAILEHRVGDVVDVTAPDGVLKYEIVKLGDSLEELQA